MIISEPCLDTIQELFSPNRRRPRCYIRGMFQLWSQLCPDAHEVSGCGVSVSVGSAKYVGVPGSVTGTVEYQDSLGPGA